jgi:hypothetical protein
MATRLRAGEPVPKAADGSYYAYWMPGNTAVENVKRVVWSALPDALVEPDSSRPQRWQHTALRARVGAALRPAHGDGCDGRAAGPEPALRITR